MVRIITDTAADFERAELERYQITCIPISVFFGDTEYRETVNLEKADFYKMLAETPEFPHTSQPAPQDFLDVFESMKAAGDEVVMITISSALSGTYSGATLAKDMAGYENCYIVDSLTATAAQRLLVMEAVRLRDAGKSAKEIADVLTQLRERVVLFACVDTLEYLYKGGRLSVASYALGSLVNIKPMLRVTREGTLDVPAKVIGRNKATRMLADFVQKTQPDADYPFYVLYSYERENAMRLVESLQAKGLSVGEQCLVSVGATIGTHAGPNAFGVVYVEMQNA